MGRPMESGGRAGVSGRHISRLVPVREDYAYVDIRDGFDWCGSVGRVAGFRAYLVVFRSVRKEGVDIGLLVARDDAAHEEAKRCEGFMHYFKGDVGGDRHCLSFCLWRDAECARSAARGRYHRLAVGIADEMYETYDLERYDIYHEDGGVVFRRVVG